MTDMMIMHTTESTKQNNSETTTEVEFVQCDCCGLTEECTPAYIQRIRERYQGKWVCGLCGEAVQDEILRSQRLISTDEAVARHVAFCRSPSSSLGQVSAAADPTVKLISAMRQILRRSLDSSSPGFVRSTPCSPMRKKDDVCSSAAAGLTRSESCIPKIRLVVDDSCSYINNGLEEEDDDDDDELRT
uniref:uncharacterized protein LOC122596450 n=1 Tax=Erigeron canadensis TaxID=72917 RepID=UPI001CB96C74|nr:uncharacterized protein LOC122596450 [Erigeron canadensis]